MQDSHLIRLNIWSAQKCQQGKVSCDGKSLHQRIPLDHQSSNSLSAGYQPFRFFIGASHCRRRCRRCRRHCRCCHRRRRLRRGCRHCRRSSQEWAKLMMTTNEPEQPRLMTKGRNSGGFFRSSSSSFPQPTFSSFFSRLVAILLPELACRVFILTIFF